MTDQDTHATTQHAGHDHPPDTNGSHGMLLFGDPSAGDDGVYLSHLPMFHHPHDYQVLLSVQFDEGSAAALRSDRATGRADLYTFLPDRFPIAELDPQSGPGRTSLTGTVFRGHFERGGTPLSRGAVARVVEVVHYEQLVDTAPTADATLQYLCFGSAGRLHLAHAITARPSFDHVVTTHVLPGSLTDMAGRALDDDVAAVTFPQARPVDVDRADTPEARLVPGETVTGTFRSTVSPSGMHGFSAQIVVDEEAYLEVAELR